MIAVLKPHMPTVEALVPYLKCIDTNGVYTNNGPLLCDLEEKLTGHFKGKTHLCSSGTTALQVMASCYEKGVCILPSWTFTASVAAVIQAGFEPFFVDVDPLTWTITPDIVEAAINRFALHDVALIMPVSAFGSPMDTDEWQAFSLKSSIPVIIDVAAGFANVKASVIPQMVSLHATKIFGAGECGAIICRDDAFMNQVKSIINFGFEGSRESRQVGFNAKVSEYTAAVGLAMWDQWPSALKDYQRIAGYYQKAFMDKPYATMQPGFGHSWLSMHANLFLNKPVRTQLQDYLLNRGIETRAWWGDGCHTHRGYQHLKHADLTVTEKLAQHMVGLPFHYYLTEVEVQTIAHEVENFMQQPQIQKYCVA